MTNLVRASRELFSRTPDETFESFDQLYQYSCTLQEHSIDRWEPPDAVTPTIMDGGQLGLTIGSTGQFQLNDWSFSQLCGLARVDKLTLNRLQIDTAVQALNETLPRGRKPLQVLTTDDRVRSVHSASYTRLYNSELLDMVRHRAGDFVPPQKGFNGATGLYAGEQDMFCFLIDPTGWVEIGGESFAPGFFIWNSEVGRRTVGIETFWFQSICANHIVWDAMEVTTFSRKHTANVHDALPEITSLLDQLVKSRDQRRDAFVRQMTAAQTAVLGVDREATLKALTGKGIPQNSIREALNMVAASGSRFTVFALVDALTRISGRIRHAGDRAEIDSRIGRLAMITTRPMRRAETAAARAAASETLLMLAGLTAIVVAAALWSSLKILIVAAWTLPVCMLCTPAPAGLSGPRWKLWLLSLQSWYSYSPSTLPGLLQSPAGSLFHRMAMLFLAAQLTGIALVRWDGSPLPDVFAIGAEHHATMNAELDAADAGRLERVKHNAVTWFFTFAAMAALPVVMPVFLVTAMVTPVLCEAALAASQSRGRNVTQSVIADIHTSPDRIEQKSIYMGRVVADGTPVLVPFKVFTEHAHGLGDSGSGKTSLFLCPLIEQLVMSGECSVIVIDLKADSLELLATQMAAAERLRAERGISIPVKCFSNQADRSTFAFNPMTQPFWDKFDLLTQTDILCGANGLTYGTDYGAGYFSSANAAVLYHAIKSFPHVRTFQELADCIGTVITTAKKQDLHPEIRKAGVHVQEVIKRLANCNALNVTDATGHDPQVVEQAIDLTKPFLEPQLLYFHLSATLSPSGAPEIGRLVNYMLLAASTQTERKHPVFLVIDEFQRMVASNLEYMLQLARSMGVGVILANQSMEDLKKSSVNLIPPIEANCRLRQWFSVSASEDRERLIQSSGETVDIDFGRKTDVKPDGEVRHSYSESERVVPRITINDVLLTSDHPFRSVLKLRTGDGYAQFGGFPVIIESEYHITETEYQRRRAMPWPSLPGMLLPGSHAPVAQPKSSSGPAISQEVIGGGEHQPNGLTPDAVDEFLTGLKQSFESPKPRRKKEKPS